LMKNSGKSTAIPILDTLFRVGALGGLSDGQLLDRLVDRREEAIFEAIERRHGPMVWGVCRRVLRDHHDAQNAYQAAFLVLARKAASVSPREKLGNWLYGVAYQTAMKARATRAKRRAREVQMPDELVAEGVSERQRDDRLSQLDRELSRLPEKYRIPIVLCELEGKTHREAAEQLGWPIGNVSGRLSRARALLASRLSRRGMLLSVGSLEALLARDTALAGVPIRLIGSTARAASQVTAGGAVMAGMVSAEVAVLTREVMKAMFLFKRKVSSAVLLMVGSAVPIGICASYHLGQADEGFRPAKTSSIEPRQPCLIARTTTRPAHPPQDRVTVIVPVVVARPVVVTETEMRPAIVLRPANVTEPVEGTRTIMEPIMVTKPVNVTRIVVKTEFVTELRAVTRPAKCSEPSPVCWGGAT
jgi:RNA polymerase sigma factor (sigma-70 family)